MKVVGDFTLPGSQYTDEEREFLTAVDRYKREQQRPFPTWQEVLQLIKSLGYRKEIAKVPTASEIER